MIEANTFSLYSGGSLQLKAIITLEDGSKKDVTDKAIWSNTPANAGTVNEFGLFFATNNRTGVESVQAAYQGLVVSVSIEVTPRASYFTILPKKTWVESGKSLPFTGAVTYQGGSEDWVTEQITWSVKPGIAAEIDERGILKTIQGMSGIETIAGTFQTLRSSSQVEIQSSYQFPFELVKIPAGPFIMGNNLGADDEQPEHEVNLDAFMIGKYEVTNAQYAHYLQEALLLREIRIENGFIFKDQAPHWSFMCTRINQPGLGEPFIFYIPGDEGLATFTVRPGFENHPVGRLTWYGADAFCSFYGLRLATEAEWEKAARGGQHLEYGTPNGSISHNLANYIGIAELDIYEEAAPVGLFPPNPFGLYDMAGNASEIVFDQYDAEYYKNSPYNNPYGVGPKQPLGLLPILITIIRGGSWLEPMEKLTTSHRGLIIEPHVNVVILENAGFRVAQSIY